MYYDILFKAFNMSVTASWLILAVILLRLVFNKAPKWMRVALWGVVGLRLLLPFSLQSKISLVPSVNTIYDPILSSGVRTPTYVGLNTGFAAIDRPYEEAMWNYAGKISDSDFDFLQLMWKILLCLWLAGIAVMLIWALVSFLRLRRQVRASVKEGKNVYLCDEVKSPFILGVFRPRIYLPSRLAGRQKELILMHERAHLKRFDFIWKPLGFLLLSVYWFNPVIWLAYILLCRDIELACDERVTKDLSEQERADYSQALLDCVHKRRAVTACPVAFGEVGVKQRVKSVLNYKKPAFWIVLAAVIAGVACAVCFLTDPKRKGTLSDSDDPELIAAVNRELCEREKSAYTGEFLTSQIVVLGEEAYPDAKNMEGTVYFFYDIESFGFENGFFTDVGGSSGATAADYKIHSDGSYELTEFSEMGMGSDYAKSIRKVFPSKLVSRALAGPTEKESEKMWQSCAESAERYLDSIGRGRVEVRRYMDVPHTTLTNLGVSTEVVNNLRIADVWEAGFVGTWETVENGVRYVQENGYDRGQNLLTFRKYVYGTNATVFDLGLDAVTGEVVYGASAPDKLPDDADGREPTVYDDMIIPETAQAIPDTSRQAAVTPFDLTGEYPAADIPGAQTTAPITESAAYSDAWTTAAAPANDKETTFSEAAEEDFSDLGTEFDSGYFLDLIDMTFLRESAPGLYTVDYDAGTVTDRQLRDLLFYASHSFICDRFLGEPETVQFTEKDDPFPELKNETNRHRYVKYDKANIDWTATYILNTKAPDPEKVLEGSAIAGYKDGYYYFVDEIFGVEDDFTAHAAKITRQSDGTYSVEVEYRDVFTEELLNGGGTAILGLRDFGGQKIWSVISYHADITWA